MKPYLAGGEKYNSVVELGFVQSFVNDYRGVIEVETSDLGGSCLRMRLPLSTVTRRE
jgi:K+-sensing histidine kinase KdpD